MNINKTVAFISSTVIIISTTITACGSNNDNEELQQTEIVETSEQQETVDYTETKQYLIDNYNFTENDLYDIDTNKFMEDYNIKDSEYTEEELKEILQQNKYNYYTQAYSARYEILNIEAPSDGYNEPGYLKNKTITRIGYEFDNGYGLKKILLELDNGRSYTGKFGAIEEAEEDIIQDVVKSVQKLEQNKYSTASDSIDGLTFWKIVFEIDNKGKEKEYVILEGRANKESDRPVLTDEEQESITVKLNELYNKFK